MASPSTAGRKKETQPLLLASDTKKTPSDSFAVQLEITKSDALDYVLNEPEPAVADEFRKLLKLAYPVVLATALEFIPGFCCILLAGHMDSPYTKEYVDAATLSTMFSTITGFSIGFGLISAMDTLCSQAYGAKRFEKLGIYFQTGLLVLAVCFVPIFFVNWFSGHILRALGQEPHVAELAQEFSRFTLFGMPFIFLYELFRKVLLAQNITQPLVFIAVVGNGVNIVSGYLLGYHTSLGFHGIALSRSLGNLAMPLLLIPYFQLNPTHFSQWWQDGWQWKSAVEHLGLFLRLGVPGLLMMVMEWWAFEVMSLLAGILPNSIVAVSAHAVLLNVTTILYTTFVGLSSATNIRVGNSLGENAPKQAQLASKVGLGLVACVALVYGSILLLLSNQVPKLFLSDPETRALASRVLVIWSPLLVIEGLNCVIQGIFRGAGKQKVAAMTNAVAYYVCGLPLAGLLAFHIHLSVEGLWLGFGFGMLVSFMLLGSLMKRWKWRQLSLDAQQRTAE